MNKNKKAGEKHICNIALIGFMGTGKSTIAGCFHTRYGMETVEMDTVISEREGMSIPEIFRIYGEEYFRNLETNLLRELQSRTNTVISCGGGVPLRRENVVEMKKTGTVVWLTAKPETILERVRHSHDRPLLEKNKSREYIEQLLEERIEKYREAADIIVSTDGKSKIDICEEIMEKLCSHMG